MLPHTRTHLERKVLDWQAIIEVHERLIKKESDLKRKRDDFASRYSLG